MDNFLHKDFDTLMENDAIGDIFDEDIIANLNSYIQLRKYQKEALQSTKYYFEGYKYSKETNPHLMFNMATGSGKTVIMAALMLYLYKRGYRNFIFFVSSKQIIEKTKANFTEPNSSKYLFRNHIQLDGRRLYVRDIENFDGTSDKDINIRFTTIQKLHDDINSVKENNLTLESMKDMKVVLLADEAHHFNQEAIKEEQSVLFDTWESVVIALFKNNRDNVLLEFTATVPLGNESIAKKYKDKLICKYDLREFRSDRYSKEIKSIEVDKEDFENLMLQAMILSQYRLKLAQKRLKLNIKPVILFKAQRTIDENKKNVEKFRNLLAKLNAGKLRRFRDSAVNNDREKGLFNKIFEFFKKEKITFHDLVDELRIDFSAEKTICTNSLEDKEKQQHILNSLEDKNNLVRAIFTVDKLNEGWDVLNLYDIVRLYNKQNVGGANKGKTPITTIRETQLIGRGARYFPFLLSAAYEKESGVLNEKFKRKFDDSPEHELRVLECFYYHSVYNSRYISELHKELEKEGLIDQTRIERKIILKDDFLSSRTYKSGYVFENEPRELEAQDIKSFASFKIKEIIISSGAMRESNLMEEGYEGGEARHTKTYSLVKDIPDTLYIPRAILKKAISRNSFYKFSNLKKKLVGIQSIEDDFILGEKYLTRIKFNVTSIITEFSHEQLLEICDKALKEIQQKIMDDIPKQVGGNEFHARPISLTFQEEKTIYRDKNGESAKAQSNTTEEGLRFEVREADWYAYNENYGTSEEKTFVKNIEQYIHKLKNKLPDAEIYLLRNELFLYLYNFEDGKRFSPDYVLIINDFQRKKIYYQLMCEPKGEHLIDKDKWKEDFLLGIEKKWLLAKKSQPYFREKSIQLIGLPFFNSAKGDFAEEMEKLIGSL